MELLIVTGMSGAGKSQAANALEDIGFYCVDNIPPAIIPSFVELSARSGDLLNKMAIVTDMRGGALFRRLMGYSATLKRIMLSIKYCFWTRLTMCLYAAIRKTGASTRWRTATICR